MKRPSTIDREDEYTQIRGKMESASKIALKSPLPLAGGGGQGVRGEK
jgi:hypothetical protein